jgi:hypothetical protein
VADYGRLASEFFEVYADESTELGRVASLMYEVNATESTEKGRVSSLMFEVNATESTEKGRVSALHFEVNVKDARAVRVSTLFAEIFLVPGTTPRGPGLQGSTFRHRRDLQGGEIKGKLKK